MGQVVYVPNTPKSRVKWRDITTKENMTLKTDRIIQITKIIRETLIEKTGVFVPI